MLLGEEKGSFIAKNLTLQGGGHPSRDAVFQTIRRCKEKGWYPGKGMGKSTGRTPDISEHQKAEVARVLMEGGESGERLLFGRPSIELAGRTQGPSMPSIACLPRFL